MLKAVQIARYRGISQLVVDKLARVNLIIGRNDSGKTALMEALRIAEHPEQAAQYLAQSQRDRLGRASTVRNYDFDRFWRPLFFGLDTSLGLSISGLDHHGTDWHGLEARPGNAPDEVIPNHDDGHGAFGDSTDDGDAGERESWSLELTLTRDGVPRRQQIVATQSIFRMPPSSSPREGGAWLTSSTGLGAAKIRYVSELKQRGQDGSLVNLLREVDRRVVGVELLAPGGSAAELFVRTRSPRCGHFFWLSKPPGTTLPIPVMLQ